jgi:E3 ubiquitin-protein ligase HERC4
MENNTIIDVKCGGNHSIVLYSSGNAYGWGDNSRGQLGFGNETYYVYSPKRIENVGNIKLISLGEKHTLILNKNNELFSFGSNTYGQLCLNNSEGHQYTPQKIDLNLNSSGDSIVIKKISCGYFHCLLLMKNSDLYSCGSNEV